MATEEDNQDTQGQEAAAPTAGTLLYPTFTQDQMLRSQAMEYASRSTDQNVVDRAQKYYDFLKGA